MPDSPRKNETMSGKSTRSARHVKTAATLLQKEARKILKRHAARIAADPAEEMRACVAAIDTYRAAGDIASLEREAERLDELLHRHATFARKSAFRETAENIAVAVLIALGLRSCFYEPFKIPSGSMMPTLRKGDHIFVNKFVYGIQVPFTSTVVGSSMGEIERGDVIVFRYPLNEAEDFIKRVIGLPGDEIKVRGRTVAIKRAGESVFEVLPRKRLSEACDDEDGQRLVADCELFEETLDGHTYVVRYMGTEEIDALAGPARVWKVPEGHLLVMGDNRNQSHDSLAWSLRVEAVAADDVLRLKDLRDLTRGQGFTLVRPEGNDEFGDPSHDHIVYRSQHRAESHDLSLAVWRDPPIAATAIHEALQARLSGVRNVPLGALLAHAPDSAEVDRARQIAASVDRFAWGDRDGKRVGIAYLEPAQSVLEFECGHAQCPDEAALALQMTAIIGAFERDREQDARQLLPRYEDARYGKHWTGRADVSDHFYETALQPPGRIEPAQTIRLRALRKPKADLVVLEEAARREAELAGNASAKPLPELGEHAVLVDRPEAFTIVVSDRSKGVMIVLDCGRARCTDARAAEALAAKVWARIPEAVADRRALRNLLRPEDASGAQLVPVRLAERDPYDRIALEATVEGEDHRLELELWRRPAEGIPAKVAAVRQRFGMQPDDTVSPGGGFVAENDAFHYVFVAPESETVLRVRCLQGLCPEADVALQLARRARSHAADPETFVDPESERPRPFVPRGHVKGRAERIWLPISRFWLPIR